MSAISQIVATHAWLAGGMVAATAALAVAVATGKVRAYLLHRKILDLPNDRSSHDLPTPRGGGLATTPVLAAVMLCLGGLLAAPALLVLGGGAVALLAISWLDDRRGLPPLPRFLAHGATVAAFLALMPGDLAVFGGVLPPWADRLVAGVAWLWFINLYNFMDGIDGITGVQTTALGIGVAAIAAVGGVAAAGIIPAGLAVAAIGAGFLVWNWHPAKIFLGDSGSIPLGYVLGGLLVLLAMHGQLAAALILPAYYLADATITLTRRALNGEKVWQAHRTHFYQRAVQGVKRHDRVALLILAGDAVLLGVALWAATGAVWPAAALTVAVVAALLATMWAWWRRGAA